MIDRDDGWRGSDELGCDLVAGFAPFRIGRGERRSKSDSTSSLCFFDAPYFTKLYREFVVVNVEVERMLFSNVINKRPQFFKAS